jgi:hypothetical protein
MSINNTKLQILLDYFIDIRKLEFRVDRTKLKIRCKSIPSKAQSKQEFREQIDLSRIWSGEALLLLKPSFTSTPYPSLPTVD